MKIGDIINNYEILDFWKDENKEDNAYFAKVKCLGCGHIKTMQKANVKRYGCQRGPCNSRFKDVTGMKFGQLTAIRYIKTEYARNTWRWECQCECGKIIVLPYNELRKGQQSCRACAIKRVAKLRKLASLTDEALIKKVFNVYKRQAKSRGIQFSLSIEEFKSVVFEPCHYCGELPTIDCYSMLRNGIDRINSDEGYTVDNCVPCCKICNVAKSNTTQEEFFAWIKKVYEHSKDSLG